ncbi:hypothetical protein B0H14DRAFT_3623983, partial [Mycena olivaceomarginata]
GTPFVRLHRSISGASFGGLSCTLKASPLPFAPLMVPTAQPRRIRPHADPILPWEIPGKKIKAGIKASTHDTATTSGFSPTYDHLIDDAIHTHPAKPSGAHRPHPALTPRLSTPSLRSPPTQPTPPPSFRFFLRSRLLSPPPTARAMPPRFPSSHRLCFLSIPVSTLCRRQQHRFCCALQFPSKDLKHCVDPPWALSAYPSPLRFPISLPASPGVLCLQRPSAAAGFVPAAIPRRPFNNALRDSSSELSRFLSGHERN